MASRSKIQWFGEELKRRSRNAQVLGVNRVMSECVIHAKNNHEWKNRTGTLEGSIRIANFGTPHASGVRGAWGSADVRYALPQELGAPKINLPARPFLVPAAEEKYPFLGTYIRQAYGR